MEEELAAKVPRWTEEEEKQLEESAAEVA